MRGLNWQPLQIPLSSGLNQKVDDRALNPPELAEAIDVQFDEVGGLQTRKPFTAIGSTIAGGGTISTARRIVANGRERVMFTKDSIYAWNDQLDRWVFRDTHLAVAVDERATYVTPGDQYDCDRAELSGIVFHAWCDTNRVYVAVADKASGAVILAPTVASSATATRPRLVALSTVVLMIWHAGTDAAPGDIVGLAFDPTATDPVTYSSALAGAPGTILAAAGSYFDVVKNPAADQAVFAARRLVTTSYEVVKIANDLSLTAVTKARTCDGPIAVAVDPTGAVIQVLRVVNGGPADEVLGDRITTAGLADAAINQVIGDSGTAVSQLTAAHRSTQDSGQYRCYAFWSGTETAAAFNWVTKSNYVDTGGAIGTQATFLRRTGIGSRAFDHGGRVFAWFTFAGESSFSGASPGAFRAALQNTYLLYRDDATLHGRAAAARAGGFSPSSGRLPGVALTTGTTVYSWCGTERRIIPVGSAGEQSSFAARAPRDITLTFDDNRARRCVRLGETLYVSGSIPLQYDGVGLFEVGFLVFPWYFAAIEVAAGNLLDGVYTYKVTFRWENARGEIDRSTTATHGNVTIAAGPNGVSIVSWIPLYNTRKLTTQPVAVEVWRTAVNPPEGAPFFLVTSKDPAATTNPNRYVPNAPTSSFLATFNDEFADSVARTKETNPENGDVLENLAPPGATIIAATDTRIFLGGVAGDPDRIWYSKARQPGQVAAFHDALTFDVPADGGDITGIAFQNGIVVVFREFAAYMFPGEGFDNLGRGQNYGPPQVVSYDVGCRDTDSIATTPEGIAFQSSKGKYLLTRGWTMKPIGLAVSDYDAEPVLAAHVVSAQHQVRFLTGDRMLVYDYLVDQWAEWTIEDGLHAAIWSGTYHYLVAAGPLAEQTTYTGTSYGLDVETAWNKPGDLQGAVGIRKPQILGEWRSTHHLWLRVAYDYKDAWVDESYWLAVPATAGLPLQHLIPTSRRKIEAIKLRITAVGAATQATMVTVADVPTQASGEHLPGFWDATFTAIPLGTLGNGIRITIGITVDAAATPFIDVRDHQTWDMATATWSALADNVGIHVTCIASVTLAAIEAAINAASNLLDVTTPHPFSALANIAGFGGNTITISETADGAFAAPTGESLKLTGLGFEVGTDPRLHKRFPRINQSV